jgi:hypothetical protein
MRVGQPSGGEDQNGRAIAAIARWGTRAGTSTYSHPALLMLSVLAIELTA